MSLEQVHGQTEGVFYLRRVLEGHLKLALLLQGPSGVGRRFSIVEAAKTLFSDEAQIYQLSQHIHPDFQVIQPENDRDIGVEAVRSLVEKTGFQPMRAPMKFLVIDGADRMTVAASNALLKVLEESPEKVRFFLLAESPDRVLPTIRSRCAPVRYYRLPEAFIVSHLMQHTDDSVKALVCSRMAEGSLGRALRFMVSGRLMLRGRMLKLLQIGPQKDLSQLFAAVDTVGSDLLLGLTFLDQLLRDLVILPYDPTQLINLDVQDELRALLASLGQDTVDSLREGVRHLRSIASRPVNLAFHTKTLLANTFC